MVQTLSSDRSDQAKANSGPKSHGSTASSPPTAPRSSASRTSPAAQGQTDEEFETGYKQHVAERGCAVPLDAWNDADGSEMHRHSVPSSSAEDLQGVELIWIAGDTGYVISGEPAVVDLMAETLAVK